jgi:hypothetical protein
MGRCAENAETGVMTRLVRTALLAMALALGGGLQTRAQTQGPAPSAPAAPAPSAPDAWLPRGAAELLMLDKLRAQPATLTIKIGQSETFGALTITVRACMVRPADQPQNAAAFLEITDSRSTAPAFRGWVLSNAPSVSQFEHPVFDLRLAGCR